MKIIELILISGLGLLVGSHGPVWAGEASSLLKDAPQTELEWKYVYNDAGFVAAMVDPGGKRTEIDYQLDEDGRLRHLTGKRSDGTQISFSFDRFGRRTRMEDAYGTVDYEYDGFGRLTAVRREDSLPLLYAYDTLNRLSSVSVGQQLKLSYTYNFQGRLKTLTTPAGDVTYDYRIGQARVTRTLPNGIRTVWEYGPDGLLSALTHVAEDNRILAQFNYAYRPDGLIRQIVEWSPRGEKTIEYGYDTVGRLIAVKDSVEGKTEYRYDPLGNRTELRVPGQPAAAAAYDWAGRLLSRKGQPCHHDGAGNLTSCDSDQRTFAYDAANRLARVTAAEGPVSYGYDGDGLLVMHSAGGRQTHYLPDPTTDIWRPLAAIDSAGRTVLYVYQGQVPIAAVSEGKTTFYLHDHLGSVRFLADDQANITAQRAYSPLGLARQAGSEGDLRPGFAGLFLDSNSGLYLTGVRGYDPHLGQFLRPDPETRSTIIGPLSAAKYAYCNGDPINFVDRNGRYPQVPDKQYWSPVDISSDTGGAQDSRPGDVWAVNPAAVSGAGDLAGVALGELSSRDDGIGTAAFFVDYLGQAKDVIEGAMHANSIQDGFKVGLGVVSMAAASTLPGQLSAQLLSGGNRFQRIEKYIGAHMRQYDAVRLVRLPFGVAPQITPRRSAWHVRPDYGTFSLTGAPGFSASGAWHRMDIHGHKMTHMHARWEVPWVRLPSGASLRGNFFRQRTESVRGDRYASRTVARSQYRVVRGGGNLTRTGRASRAVDPGDLSAMRPTNVGGVYLRGAKEALSHLGRLQGVAIGATDGRLVLLSEQVGEVELPPLRLDDVVTIFRTVYEQGDAPFVSIDPKPENPKGPLMTVRHSPGTENTYVGWVLFETDRLMKAYSLGRDNITHEPVTSQVSGYRSLLDLGFSNIDDGHAEPQWERFWIVPAAVNRRQAADQALTLLDVPLKVKTQAMVLEGGKLVPKPGAEPSPEAAAFAKWFTQRYDDIAGEARLLPPPESGIERPVALYRELERIAVVTAIAETLRDEGVPLPAWMQDHHVKPVPVTPTTPSLLVEASRTDRRDEDRNDSPVAVETTYTQQIFGGVRLAADDKDVHTVPAAPKAQALASAVSQALAGSPVLEPVSVEQGGDRYEAVALPGADTRELGACLLAETDLVVPLPRGGVITLERKFHSFFRPVDVLGGAWTLDLPRLEAQRRPVSRSGDRTEYRQVFQLGTPLGTRAETFSETRYVPEVNAELLVPAGESDILGLGSMVDDRVGRSTQVVLFRDGRRWHFDDQGYLVAQESTPLLVLYHRDPSHRLQRMEARYGAQREAEITLQYDDEGRLRSAKGSNGDQVSYRYNAAGELIKVEWFDGTVKYAYQNGLVSAISSQGETLREFTYNAHGQLLSERRADGSTVSYAQSRGPQGVRMTAETEGPHQAVESAEYDTALRPIQRVFADGTRIAWQYPDDGDVETVIDLPGDERFLLTESGDGSVRTLQIPEGGTYAAQYDAPGRLTALSRGGQETLRQQWAGDGLLAQAVYETVALHPQYDPHGVLNGALVTPPEGGPKFSRWMRIDYDDQGRPAVLTDYSGMELKIAYDPSGRPGKLASNTGRVEITRDEKDRVTSIVARAGDDGPDGWDYRQENTYDSDGEPKRIEISQGGAKEVIELEQGRPTLLRRFDGGETQLTYYENSPLEGRIKTVQAPNGLTLRYDYDAEGRIAGVDVGGAYRVGYLYDAQGRLVGMVDRPSDR